MNKDFSVFKEPTIQNASHKKDSLEILLATQTWGGCVERVVYTEDASREAVAKFPWLDLQAGAGRRDGHCPWC